MVQTPHSEKNKFSTEKEKIKNFKIEKIKKSSFLSYTCVCARERRKIWVYFQMCDVIKYQIMPFKGIFSPAERILYAWWTIYPPCLRKRLRTL